MRKCRKQWFEAGSAAIFFFIAGVLAAPAAEQAIAGERASAAALARIFHQEGERFGLSPAVYIQNRYIHEVMAAERILAGLYAQYRAGTPEVEQAAPAGAQVRVIDTGLCLDFDGSPLRFYVQSGADIPPEFINYTLVHQISKPGQVFSVFRKEPARTALLAKRAAQVLADTTAFAAWLDVLTREKVPADRIYTAIELADKSREEIAALGHILVEGMVNWRDGKIVVGRHWGTHQQQRGSKYHLELFNGFAVRLHFFRDGSDKIFYPVFDIASGAVIDAYADRISAEQFVEYRHAAVVVRLAGEGSLSLGGGRPFVDGAFPEKQRPWAKFGAEFSGQLVLAAIQSGHLQSYVDRCVFLQTNKDEWFSLVRRKSAEQVITSFWKKLVAQEFNRLGEDNVIDRYFLDDAYLNIGGRNKMISFGREAVGRPVRIDDIRNPSGDYALVCGAQVELADGAVVRKDLSQIYGVKSGGNAESFERGNLFNVFEHWSEDRLSHVQRRRQR
ncbi:MAG: hypothetical protein NC924_01210, partial [Candidatus Omnitrophica bacterium]|nr:hypothetical protein [Candidatus Omnitrophota bacterium]